MGAGKGPGIRPIWPNRGPLKLSANTVISSTWRVLDINCVSKTGGARGRGDLEVAVQYAGPAVLPWLWHPLEQDGETVQLPQPIPHHAGPSGAEGSPHRTTTLRMLLQ